MPFFYFWVVLALLYLVLSVVTWLTSRPIEKAFALLKEPGDTLVSVNESGKEVGLESTLHKAYKTIITTNIVGFVLAALAAGVTAIYL
jgi:hypothetical protein